MNDNDSHYRSQGEKRASRLLPLLVLLSLAAAGCGDDATGDGPLVVATTTILGDVAAEVVGDAGTVDVLLPIGADPHGYQASSRQAAALRTADLVVANGLGLEEGLTDVLEGAAADGARILWAGDLVETIPFLAAGHHEDDGHDHADGSPDPHIWLDPLRMADVARGIAAALEESHPGGGWAGRAEAYAADLAAADDRIAAILSVVPPERRTLVTTHGSFGYFAGRYGFEIAGTVIPGGSTMAGPSSADLADLISTIEQEGVAAVFGETTDPTALIDAVAAEIGAPIEIVSLHTGSLGGPGSGAETLIEMLVGNATLIAGALG